MSVPFASHEINPYTEERWNNLSWEIFMFSKLLPITKFLPQIKQCMDSHRIIFVNAGQGSGKTSLVSLQVMEWIGEKVGFGLPDTCCVLVEARAIAAEKSCERICQSLDLDKGEGGIGIATDQTNFGSYKHSYLMVETYGRSLSKAMAGHWDTIKVVIFDEVHLMDFKVQSMLHLLPHILEEYTELKIIFLTGSVRMEHILRNILRDEFSYALLGTNQRPFKLTREKCIDTTDHEWVRKMKLLLRETKTNDPTTLYFVTTPRLAEEIANEEANRRGSLNDGGTIRPIDFLHGKQELAVQLSIMANFINHRDIIATNVVQESLTIRKIRRVVDCCRSLQPFYRSADGVKGVKTLPISGDDAIQRCTRAGRESDGSYVRLLDDAKLREETTLIYEDAPWIWLTVAARQLRLGKENEPPPLRGLLPNLFEAHTVELLQDAGLLDDTGRITVLGERVQAISLPPQLGAFVCKAHDEEEQLGHLALMIAVVLASELKVVQKVNCHPFKQLLDIVRRAEAPPEVTVAAQCIETPALCIETRRIMREVQKLRAVLGWEQRILKEPFDNPNWGTILASILGEVWPGRVARRIQSFQYELPGGTVVNLPETFSITEDTVLLLKIFQVENARVRASLVVPFCTPPVHERVHIYLIGDSSLSGFEEIICRGFRRAGYHRATCIARSGARASDLSKIIEDVPCDGFVVCVYALNDAFPLGGGWTTQTTFSSSADQGIEKLMRTLASRNNQRVIAIIPNADPYPGIRDRPRFNVHAASVRDRFRQAGILVSEGGELSRVRTATDGIHFRSDEGAALTMAIRNSIRDVLGGSWDSVLTMSHDGLPGPSITGSNTIQVFTQPRASSFPSLPAVEALENVTVRFFQFAVRHQRCSAGDRWWVVIFVSSLVTTFQKITMDAHITVGYPKSGNEAADLVNHLVNISDLGTAAFRMNINRDCWPKDSSESVYLDIYDPASSARGLLAILEKAWTEVVKDDVAKGNMHLSLTCNFPSMVEPIPVSGSGGFHASLPNAFPTNSSLVKRIGRCIEKYEEEDENHFMLHVGEFVEIYEDPQYERDRDENRWLCGQILNTARVGWFPRRRIAVLPLLVDAV